MKCPYCNNDDTKVVDKRETENDEATRRRRECLKCERRFTTYERPELIDIMVIKKSGEKELFDRTKVLRGLVRALEKRPVEPEIINNIAEDIEQEIRAKEEKEITSNKIGSIVLRKLKKIDHIAYIRFASVYREFADIDDFQNEMQKLVKVEVKKTIE